MRSTAARAAATTARCSSRGSPASVKTARWWSGSAWTSSTLPPAPAKAAPIASRIPRSRPSDTLGTASSSGVSPSGRSGDRVDGEQKPGEDDDHEGREESEGDRARHGPRIIARVGIGRARRASSSTCSHPPPPSPARSPPTASARSASPRTPPGAGASPADPTRDHGRMEAVVLCGVQGSGKTTLYRDRFLETHVRVSMDLLRTRAREAAFVRACLDTGQRFVVDNTNPTPAERRRYVEPARAARFRVIGYLVEIKAAEALARNAERPDRRRGPPARPGGTPPPA